MREPVDTRQRARRRNACTDREKKLVTHFLGNHSIANGLLFTFSIAYYLVLLRLRNELGSVLTCGFVILQRGR